MKLLGRFKEAMDIQLSTRQQYSRVPHNYTLDLDGIYVYGGDTFSQVFIWHSQKCSMHMRVQTFHITGKITYIKNIFTVFTSDAEKTFTDLIGLRDYLEVVSTSFSHRDGLFADKTSLPFANGNTHPI